MGHAALVGGTFAQRVDFDDTHLPSVLHPSASVVPAALAARRPSGRRAQVSGRVGVGDEVTCRLGMAQYDEELGNSVFFERGLHATAICGAIGAAVAAAMALGLDANGAAMLGSIAASMGSGIIEANRTGGTVKRVHCGWAAHAGVMPPTWRGRPDGAAHRAGGPVRILPGVLRRDRRPSPQSPANSATGGSWAVTSSRTRQPLHPYRIDAAITLRERRVTSSDIDRVEIGLPSPVLRTVAEPRELKIRPVGLCGALQLAVHIRRGAAGRRWTGSVLSTI